MKKIRKHIYSIIAVVLFSSIIISCSNNKVDELFSLPENFNKSYKIISNENLPVANVERISIKISVPTGLPKSELENNIKHCIKEHYLNNPKLGAINVFAYRNDMETKGAYTAASCDFAPQGKWENAKSDANINDFQFNFKHSDIYAKKIEENNYVGETAKLNSEFSDYVAISDKKNSWGDEDIIERIPNGNTVKIIDFFSKTMTANYTLKRAKVEINYKNNKIIGWVAFSDLKID